ncbi:HAMP domain-containing sensor histidine kinase [Ferrovibrio sp.]|uniref:sensor histidine kinase n=1 Tax=Ferrovibrio sp. TaxID=1917215 RepID=UPI0025BCAC8E|nr:HAMP domain-containing sensor histidine kinase [Ferrovibrio sp.]MBX3453888.1 HAMP domain-containing histidine kinase [Ferrovibrio sp.]
MITFVVTVVQAIAWMLMWRSNRSIPGLGLWTCGIYILAAAFLLYILRGTIPDMLSITVGNVGVVLGHAFMIMGIADLLERPRPLFMAWFPVPLVAVLWSYWMATDPTNLGLRVTVSSCMSTIQYSAMCWVILGADRLTLAVRGPLSTVYGIHAGLSLVRAVMTAHEPVFGDFMASSSGQSFWVLEILLAGIAVAVSFSVLLGGRLAVDLAERNLKLAEEVADRRHLQQTLSEALMRESGMRREQRQFIGLIGREFQRPLQTISDAGQELRGQIGEQPVIQPRLDAVADAVRRLRLLIDTFLLDEKLASGTMEIRQDAVAIGALLRQQATSQAQPRAEQRLQLSLAEPDLVVAGDAAMLGVVFGNLFDNALKYSPTDRAVDVTLRREGDEAVVTVRDHGIGIPERELSAVGRRFYRASNAAGVPGTGLGLYGAGRQIQLHGGHFDIQSKPNEGTRITVRLPLLSALADLDGAA